jgi:hypothetical protein
MPFAVSISVGVITLCVGVLLLAATASWVYFVVSRVRREARSQANVHGEDLQLLVQAVLSPAFRQYLASSEAGETLDTSEPDQAPMYLRRLRHILLDPSAREARRLGSDEIAVGLAVLEDRINTLGRDIVRIERNSIGRDGLAWSILTVLGAVTGVLAGVVGIVSGIVVLLG